MTGKNEKNTSLWWMYVDNKKIQNPVTLNDVREFCNQKNQFNFKLVSYLLVNGTSIKSSFGRIRIKKVSQTDLTQQSISEALWKINSYQFFLFYCSHYQRLLMGLVIMAVFHLQPRLINLLICFPVKPGEIARENDGG